MIQKKALFQHMQDTMLEIDYTDYLHKKLLEGLEFLIILHAEKKKSQEFSIC